MGDNFNNYNCATHSGSDLKLAKRTAFGLVPRMDLLMGCWWEYWMELIKKINEGTREDL